MTAQPTTGAKSRSMDLEPRSITVAQVLQGTLMDVATSEGFERSESVLAMSDIALSLTSFKEEGVEMHPEVLVARDVDEVARALQAQDRIVLGKGGDATEAVARLLKHAAPLCRDGWFAYAQFEQNVEFGMLRQSSSPLALTLSFGISECSSPAILFYQDVSSAVRVVGARGALVDINLTGSLAISTALPPIHELSLAMVESLPDGEPELAARVMEKIVTQALRQGHGSLVAVVPGNGPALPPDLFGQDRILLPPHCCLDIGKRIRACAERNELEEASALQGAASLLCGMMMSDGITVFSSAAQVLAYRAFLAPRVGDVTGGARRRTYLTLCEEVGKSLTAAFMRSQDGHMEIMRHRV